MSDPQQPQDWQWPQPGGQPWQGAQPQPGGQPWPAQPQTGFPAPGYGPPVRRPRRWLVHKIIVVALIAAGIGGLVAFSNASKSSKGKITLPATLLNLHKNTSTGATHLAGALMRGEATSSHGRLKDVKAGVYGSPTAAWLAVAAGGICGTCFAKS